MRKARISINFTPPLATLFLVLFVGLKLTGYIAWSWWWVLSPLWIGPLIILGIVATIVLVSLAVMIFAGRRGR